MLCSATVLFSTAAARGLYTWNFPPGEAIHACMRAGIPRKQRKREIKKGTRQGERGLDRRGSKAQLDLEALSNVKSNLFPPRKGKAGRRRKRKSIDGEKTSACLPAPALARPKSHARTNAYGFFPPLGGKKGRTRQRWRQA